VLVTPAGPGFGGYYRALARLPGAAAVAPFAGLNGQTMGQHVTPVDHRLRSLVDRPKVLAGRLPRPDRPGEIALDQHGAAILHVHVGSTLGMEVIRADGLPGARKLRERVVGIVVTRSSVKPVTDQDKFPTILVSAALMRDLGPGYIAIDWAAVRLQPGTTLDSFRRRAEVLARRFPGPQGQVSVVDEHALAASIERAIRPEAVALALFALVLLLVALLVVGQVATRLLAASSSDNPVLAALGMTRGQLMASGLLEVGVAAAAGAVAAIGVAVAASPLMPIGTARLAEPAPGVSIDMAVLAVGAIAIAGLVVARAAWPAWRLASARGTAGALSSEGSPDPAAAIASEHRHSNGELDHADHALKSDVPGGAARRQIPRQLQRGRWHAQHPSEEGDEDQPEGPPPSPHDANANHRDEARQPRRENDLRRRLATRRLAQSPVIDLRCHH
jgi:hypothetical protein